MRAIIYRWYSLIVRYSFLSSLSLFRFRENGRGTTGVRMCVRYSRFCSKRRGLAEPGGDAIESIGGTLCLRCAPKTIHVVPSHIPFSSSIASRRNGHTYRYLTSINFRLDASYWVKELCKAFTVTNKLMAFGSRWLMSLEFTLAFVNGNSINARINKSVTRYPGRR